MPKKFNPLVPPFDYYEESNILPGTTQGQLFYWDDTLRKLTHTETSEMFWDDTGKILTFGNFPITPSSAPTTNYQVANKKYVDDNAGGAPEGIVVKSTGEGGAIKFLREDGDGTCSWQTPAGSGDVTAAVNLTDETLVQGDGGAKGVKTSTVTAQNVIDNTAKLTNVSTNLSEGTSTTTTVDVNSSDGTNATLVSASASRAGVLTKDKFDEIVSNNSKVSESTTVTDTNTLDLTLNTYNITADLKYEDSATIDLTDSASGLKAEVSTDSINDTHIDWGTGANQVSAVDVPIEDVAENFTGIEVETALTELTTREEWEANGFEDRDDSTLAWNDGTYTLSIQPTATNFTYWVEGIKYVSTGDTVQIDNTKEGIHVIYYVGDTLTSMANPTEGDIGSIIRRQAIACIIYWDTSTATAIYVGEERHGKVMSPETHAYLHFLEGLRYVSGLGLNTFSVDGTGITVDAQFGVDSGAVSDEDLYLPSTAVLPTTGCPIYHQTGTGEWNKTVVAGFSVRTFDNTDATRLAWNEFTGGAWQLTEVDNNDFVLCHIFATTEKDTPMIAIMGQAEYNTKRLARQGALTEIRSLVLDDLLFPEIRPIATIIFQTNTGYVSTVNAKVVSTDEGDDYIDWRSETISRTEVSTSDHGALTGLDADDHTQYSLVDGTRAFTGVVGGITPTADAHLSTKKYVDDNGGASPLTTKGDLFGYSTLDARLPVGTNDQVLTADSGETLGVKWADAGGASYWDRDAINGYIYPATLTDNVGIGITTPAQKLDVAGKIALNGTQVAYMPTAYIGTLILGDGGGRLDTGANYNTFVGIGAGDSNTTGERNTADGYQSLYSNTTGRYNTANGMYSLRSNTTGERNTANGNNSLYSNTTGRYNTANGYDSLRSNTTGTRNTANGAYSLRSNTTGSYNTANGAYSLYFNTTGIQNTANGYASLYSNTTGNYNFGLGFNAGRFIADGVTANETGTYNTFIGTNTKALADGDTNETVIGNSAVGIGSNSVVLGNDDIITTLLKGDVSTLGTIKGGGFESSDGSAGITTSFTNGDGNTVTVKNGLITDIS